MLKRALAILAALALMPTAGAELDLTTPPPETQEIENTNRAPTMSQDTLIDTAPINLSCAEAVLMEASTGQVIFEYNSNDTRPVASVTKVMTILLALEAIDAGRVRLDDPITISATASGMGGSQILLDTGEVQPFSALLKSTIVASANDSAVAIAECLYGSQELFVSRMNQRAAELGMTNTNFVNCTGLPAEGQYTTAHDVAIMSAEMLSHPLYYEFSGIWMENFDHGDGRTTEMVNTNKLLKRYDGCDGGKTGSTDEAGYCMTATAQRGGMRLIAVALGSSSSSDRFEAISDMFDYGFANYRLLNVADAGTAIRGKLPVTGGTSDSIALKLRDGLTVLVAKGAEQGVELRPELPDFIAAPVSEGQILGKVNVVLGGEIISQLDVIAAEAVDESSLGHSIDRIFRNWL